MPNSGTIVLTTNYEYSWKVHVSSRRRTRCKRGPTPLWNLQYMRISQHEYAYKLILRVESRKLAFYKRRHRLTLLPLLRLTIQVKYFVRWKNCHGDKISVICFCSLQNPSALSASDYYSNIVFIFGEIIWKHLLFHFDITCKTIRYVLIGFHN